MNILIEHIVHVPYTGKITGGTERFVNLASDALRTVGHRVSIMGPADSTGECVLSSVPSEQVASPINFRDWYRSIRDRAQVYDAIMLNQPLTLQWVLDPELDFMLKRSTYINHNGLRWYTEGRAGLRLSACLQYMRSRGGRAFYLSKKNRDALEAVAKGEVTRAVIAKECRGGVKRVGSDSFLGTALFDGHFDEAVYPPNAVIARAPLALFSR